MKLLRKLRGFFRKEKLDAEMAEEMRAHLELQTQENLARGMVPDEARFAARRQFGGVEQVKERAREQRSLVLLEHLVRDLRHTGRSLRRNPGLTATVVLTLALCIGANTAIFSAVYALMLKPLPFPAPNRIVEIYYTYAKADLSKGAAGLIQYLNYKGNAKSFSELGLWEPYDAMFGEDVTAQRLWSARVSADFFNVLGLKPLIGQFFTLENSRPSEDKVVVLTHSFWAAQFNEDPGVIGQTTRLDGETLTIVGVAPRAFEAFDARVRFVRPYVWDPAASPANVAGAVQLFGRVKPDTTLALATAETDALDRLYLETAPPAWRASNESTGARVQLGLVQAARAQSLKSTLLMLQGGVIFVLLIGCVNVANLLLARANGRRAELAIRITLGATRGAIMRQLLLETLALTLFGTAVGLSVASAAIGIMNHYRATMMAEALPFQLDGQVLGVTIAVSVVAALVIGVLPIIHLRRVNLLETVHRNSRSASGSAGMRALSGGLIVGQIAVAFVLLTGAGLLIHSFANALSVEPGFDAKGVITGRIAIPLAHRFSNEVAQSIRERIQQTMQEIPGVSSMAMARSMPFQAGMGVGEITLAAGPLPPGALQPVAARVGVSPEYFETLRLQLVEGRFLERADAGRRGLVVDENFARKFFPARSALGGHFGVGAVGVRPFNDSTWATIVGVVRNVPQNGVEDRGSSPFYYFSYGGVSAGLTLFLRTGRPTAEVVAIMREKLRAIDPAIALYDTGPLQSFVDASFNGRRIVMFLLGGFATLALFLSALGIYGVLAYDVSQRTREIGIRGALGAAPGRVVAMVFGQGMWKAGLGLAIGLIGAGMMSRTMQSLLFELTVTDPSTYAAASVVLLIVAAFACWLPARRAAKVDPVIALRAE